MLDMGLQKISKKIENAETLISNLQSFTFMAHFLWMGFSCLEATEPLSGGSLLFTNKFPEIPGTHLIDLQRMKG